MEGYNLGHQEHRPGDYSKYAEILNGEMFAIDLAQLLFGEQEKPPKSEYNADCYWYKSLLGVQSEKTCTKNHGFNECGKCKDYISKSAITDFVQDNLSKLLNG